MTAAQAIAGGYAALEAGQWAQARAAFEAALAERETPEALDGMGSVLWWLGETRSSVEHSERAYAGFRRSGDTVRAAMTALNLCVTYISNYGNPAAAGGWLGRAERLMGDADPNPLRGWLWLTRGFVATDPATAAELQERALQFARASGDHDLELCALGDLGLTLVTRGEAEAGLALIDEAMAGTLGGENSHLDTVVFACCDMLVACDLAGDLQRATQWCRVADEFIRRYGCPFLYARCRTLYGSVLVGKGQWAAAERESAAAVRMSEEAGPAVHGEALARLADLRLRQGRLEEAEALLPGLGGGRVAARTAARLRLARGEPAVAVGLLERSLEHHGEPSIHGEHHLQAAAALETLVAAQLALGDPDAAAAAAARIAASRAPRNAGTSRRWRRSARRAPRPPATGPTTPGAGSSGRWTCSRAWSSPTRRRWCGWSWPAPWRHATPRWRSPRRATPSASSSSSAPPATPTRPRRCCGRLGRRHGPGPSTSACSPGASRRCSAWSDWGCPIPRSPSACSSAARPPPIT
jgi:tetratricopeptide (TPR) repeat protein